MYNVEKFNHEELGEIYVIGNEKGLWFSYKEVAKILRLKKHSINNIYCYKIDYMDKMEVMVDKGEGEGIERFISDNILRQFINKTLEKVIDFECELYEFEYWINRIERDMCALQLNEEEVYENVFRSDWEYIYNTVTEDESGVYDNIKRNVERMNKNSDFIWKTKRFKPKYDENKTLNDKLNEFKQDVEVRKFVNMLKSNDNNKIELDVNISIDFNVDNDVEDIESLFDDVEE